MLGHSVQHAYAKTCCTIVSDALISFQKHSSADCKFRQATCNHCERKGHISPICWSKTKPQQTSTLQAKSVRQSRYRKRQHHSTHHVQESANPRPSDTKASSGEEYHQYRLNEHSSEPINVTVMINGKQLTMELDTGVAVSYHFEPH